MYIYYKTVIHFRLKDIYSCHVAHISYAMTRYQMSRHWDIDDCYITIDPDNFESILAATQQNYSLCGTYELNAHAGYRYLYYIIFLHRN